MSTLTIRAAISEVADIGGQCLETNIHNFIVLFGAVNC